MRDRGSESGTDDRRAAERRPGPESRERDRTPRRVLAARTRSTSSGCRSQSTAGGRVSAARWTGIDTLALVITVCQIPVLLWLLVPGSFYIDDFRRDGRTPP